MRTRLRTRSSLDTPRHAGRQRKARAKEAGQKPATAGTNLALALFAKAQCKGGVRKALVAAIPLVVLYILLHMFPSSEGVSDPRPSLGAAVGALLGRGAFLS